MSYSQVGGDKIFLLVDCGDVGLFDFFADHLEERGVSEVGRRVGGAERESVLMMAMKVIRGNVGASQGREKGRLGQLTGIRSAYFWRMRSASALRFSKGCSSLNLERILFALLGTLTDST